MKVIIVNYNSGNLASLYNSFFRVATDRKIKINLLISNNPKEIEKADRLVLPGVGDFSNCKNQLIKIKGMEQAVYDFVNIKQRPFLGICIGMQLMAKKSFERIETKGLGFIESEVKKILPDSKAIKVPHIGWNNIKLVDNSYKKSFNSLVEGDYYFVHSYEMVCSRSEDIVATVNYGKEIVAVAGRENILGVQFHPEKSQKKGQKFINDFLSWNP